MNNSFHDIVVDYVTHTDSAVLVKDGDREVWLPRVAVRFADQDGTTPHLFDDLSPGENYLFEVMDWLLEKTGLSELAENDRTARILERDLNAEYAKELYEEKHPHFIRDENDL